MAYYKATICRDGAGSQVVVHWDENDPNRFITAPRMVPGGLVDARHLEEVLESDGWRLASAGSDNIGRGWAIVKRRESQWTFYNPITRDWYMFLSDDDKARIRETYPDAEVPGVH